VLPTYGATEYTQNVTQAPRDGDPSSGRPNPPPLHAGEDGRADGDVIERECVDETASSRQGSKRHAGLPRAEIQRGRLHPRRLVQLATSRFDDGHLWLTGCVKDVIIRGGHNIDPSVIEETLLARMPRCRGGASPTPMPANCRSPMSNWCRERAPRPRRSVICVEHRSGGGERDRHRGEDAVTDAEAAGSSCAVTPPGGVPRGAGRRGDLLRSTSWPTRSKATRRITVAAAPTRVRVEETINERMKASRPPTPCNGQNDAERCHSWLDPATPEPAHWRQQA
jgi:hypothetical protein